MDEELFGFYAPDRNSTSLLTAKRTYWKAIIESSQNPTHTNAHSFQPILYEHQTHVRMY